MEYLTLIEIAEKLRVSKHTIQSWLSPSSPNFKPEFSSLSRHAGRKTVFIWEEVELWLEQRKGSIYSSEVANVSAYWLEKFLRYRGDFKGILKAPIISSLKKGVTFSGGKLALDMETLCIWLTNEKNADKIYKIIEKAESLMLSTSLAYWLLNHLNKTKQAYSKMKKLLESNIFELAPFNEEALRMALDIENMINTGNNAKVNEFIIRSYASCIANGATSMLCSNNDLFLYNGLKITGF